MESKNWTNCRIDPAAGSSASSRCLGEKKDRIGVERRRKFDLLLGNTNCGRSVDEEDIVFTDLSPRSLAERLDRDGALTVGRDVDYHAGYDEAGIRLRHRFVNDIPGGEHPDRNAQFERIAELIEQYESEGNPWFSVDTKAKEHLGKLYRKGRIRGSEPFKAFDHDFPSWADGVVIPHGIFDRKLNVGHINIGLSRDTTEFACDSFRWYWNRIARMAMQLRFC